MTKMSQIDQFLSATPIAMAGASRNPRKFGFVAFKELTDKGLVLLPVNPNATEIYNKKSFRSVSELPEGIDSLIIMTPRNETAGVVVEAKAKGIRNIWIQQMSDTPEAIAAAAGEGINLITGECIMMYHRPTGLHKFHRALKKLFGRLPK